MRKTMTVIVYHMLSLELSNNAQKYHTSDILTVNSAVYFITPISAVILAVTFIYIPNTSSIFTRHRIFAARRAVDFVAEVATIVKPVTTFNIRYAMLLRASKSII